MVMVTDWPIRYKDLASWYSYVEIHAGISGSAEGLEQLPDSEFLPAFEMTAPELAIKASIEKNFPGRKMIMGRTAHLTKANWIYISLRGACNVRHVMNVKKAARLAPTFQPKVQHSPQRLKPETYILRQIVWCIAWFMTRVASAWKVSELSTTMISVSVILWQGYIFVCFEPLAAPRSCFNSKSKSFPDGIANSSGVLGHYLKNHKL